MKIFLTASVILLLASAGNAQPASAPPARPAQPAPTIDVQAIQDWVSNNVGDDVFQSLGQIDQDRVRDFFAQLQQQFQGVSIYQMGSLKAVAVQVLPVLDEFEETQPYAVWLRAHLDDLDVAEEAQREMRAANPKPEAATPLPEPTPRVMRSVWVRELRNRPWPPLARTYVPELKPVFAAEGVPPQLVWVAGVESSFDRNARSPAGAAGMFQLMPATARTEHLSLWPFDQRYQPEKSARAAAHYLRSLHEHYGDWPLALAAYNVGEGRVDKLLKDHNANSFDAIARWLPAETRMYVPKVEATIFLREGVALADLKTPRA